MRTKCPLNYTECFLNVVGEQAKFGTLADPAGYDGVACCQQDLVIVS
jgi:hypothetical protein